MENTMVNNFLWDDGGFHQVWGIIPGGGYMPGLILSSKIFDRISAWDDSIIANYCFWNLFAVKRKLPFTEFRAD